MLYLFLFFMNPLFFPLKYFPIFAHIITLGFFSDIFASALNILKLKLYSLPEKISMTPE